MKVKLPWPSRVLFPNARPHWAQKAKAVKMHRTLARLSVNPSAMFPNGKVFWRLDYFPPNRRRRDEDNLISACKAYLDGIAEGLGIDDSRFRLREIREHDVVKDGAVHLTFWSDTDGIS